MKKCACKDGRRCPRHLLGDVVFALEKEIEANKTNLGKDLRNFRSSSKPEDVLTALAHVHATVVRATKMTINKYAIKKIKATLADKTPRNSRMDPLMGWEEVAAACRAELPIAGIVESRKKGGFRVRLASGIVAFLPLSQADSAIVREPASLVGKAFDFLVVRCNAAKKNVVLSRRRLLERARDTLKCATLSSLAEGQIVSGVVSSITDSTRRPSASS